MKKTIKIMKFKPLISVEQTTALNETILTTILNYLINILSDYIMQVLQLTFLQVTSIIKYL